MFIRQRKITALIERLQRYFLGDSVVLPPSANLSVLILSTEGQDTLPMQLSLINSGGYGGQFKSVVIIEPVFEPLLIKEIYLSITKNIIVLTPRDLIDVKKMINMLDVLGNNILIITVNLSQLPYGHKAKLGFNETQYSLAFCGIYKELKRIALQKSYSLVVLDDFDNLGQRNSAFLRRLFPRNTT
jgi:hypothetical protein